MRVCAGIDELAAHERYAAATPDLVAAIAEGIGQFAAGEWAPLNRIGDTQGAAIRDGIVRLPNGFAEAYHAYVAAGWNSIAGPAGFGGQDLPFTLACCVMENLGAANQPECAIRQCCANNDTSLPNDTALPRPCKNRQP